MTIHYIYALCCPDTEEVKYIGESKNVKTRFKVHLRDAKHNNNPSRVKENWIINLLENNKKPILKIIEKCNGDNYQERERYWIKKYGRKNLLNASDGGEYGNGPNLDFENWMKWFKILEKYHKKYGHSNPKQIEKFLNENIGKWCNWQRYFFKENKLTEDRIKKLEKIDFDLNPREKTWIKKYNLLLEFIKEKNRFPKDKEMYKNQGIGHWCRKQRLRFQDNTLEKNKIKLLKKVGFGVEDINLNDKIWNNRFDLLKKYSIEKGHSSPRNKEKYDNFAIGLWCYTQRKKYKENKLSQYKIDILNSINFPWNYVKNILEKIHDKMTLSEVSKKLNITLCSLRYGVYQGKIKAEKILGSSSLLLGFSEIERISQILEKRKKSISLNEIAKYFKVNYETVLRWTHENKLNYYTDTLDNKIRVEPDEFEKLKKRIEQNPIKKPKEKVIQKEWTNKEIQELKQMISEYISPLEISKKLNRSSSSIVHKIERLGINYNYDVVIWEKSFNLLKKYIDEKNNVSPTRKEKFDNFNVGLWCHTQRCKFRKGKLDKWKIDLLNSINFPWNPRENT